MTGKAGSRRKTTQERERKSMEKKNGAWTADETKCLLAIWASPVFQEKWESLTRKSRLYIELSEEMAKAGFTRTPDQIINKLKKLKKDYTDTKKDLNKSGAGRGDMGETYELLDTVMGHRPANQVTGALNSATAATTIDESTSSTYADESDTTISSEPTTSAASEEREIPDQSRARKKGRQRRREVNSNILEYLVESDERAEVREERMMQQMQQSTTSLLGLVERMVSAIEGVSNPNRGQD